MPDQPKDVPVLISPSKHGPVHIPLAKAVRGQGSAPSPFPWPSSVPPAVPSALSAPVLPAVELPSPVLSPVAMPPVVMSPSGELPVSESSEPQTPSLSQSLPPVPLSGTITAESMAAFQAAQVEYDRRRDYRALAAQIFARDPLATPEAAFRKAAAFFQYAALEGLL